MLVRPAAFSFLCCSTSASIVSGGEGGSWTSALARSISSPLSSPFASRVMRPPGCCGVSLVMFHFRSAAELRMYSWPPRTRTTGFAGDTVSRSAAVRQAVLLQLRLVPVAVRDDDVAGTALLHARGDGGEDVGEAARGGEIDAGPAARVVQVTVGEPGDHRLAVQIDRRRLRAGELPDRGVGADRAELAAGDRDRFRDREPRVDGDHVAVDQDRVRRRRRRLCAERQQGGEYRQSAWAADLDFRTPPGATVHGRANVEIVTPLIAPPRASACAACRCRRSRS